MKIAVLSGKGGTGKTTVSLNLTKVIKNVDIIDTDIEEPNVHLFMGIKDRVEGDIYIDVPFVNKELCDGCGKCSEFCKYSAIFQAKDFPIIFEESCHSCGGCEIVCPKGAIKYVKREIGKVYNGSFNGVKVGYGVLNIGEKSGVKIIKELKKDFIGSENLVIDSPPGTACSTVNAVDGVDYAVVVTEPTPFGLSDMKLVLEMLDKLNIQYGVVINKSDIGDDSVKRYLLEENIKILGEIPFDRRLLENYSVGKLYDEMDSVIMKKFEDIYKNIVGDLSETN